MKLKTTIILLSIVVVSMLAASCASTSNKNGEILDTYNGWQLETLKNTEGDTIAYRVAARSRNYEDAIFLSECSPVRLNSGDYAILIYLPNAMPFQNGKYMLETQFDDENIMGSTWWRLNEKTLAVTIKDPTLDHFMLSKQWRIKLPYNDTLNKEPIAVFSMEGFTSLTEMAIGKCQLTGDSFLPTKSGG